MKKLFALLCCAAFGHTNAQNLLPNPSFESASYCPTTYNSGWMGGYSQPAICDFWYQPTAGTPDYFNTCDTTGWMEQYIPNNNEGFQRPFAGHAYVGMYNYVVDDSDYKEYLMARIPALHPGATYIMTMRISLANHSNFATDGFGVLFNTYGPADTTLITSINLVPQVDYTGYGVVSDTMNWVTLVDSFVADSAYTNIILGNFKNTLTMHVDTVDTSGINGLSYAYYYIDSVSLMELNPLAVSNVNALSSAKIYPDPLTEQATLTFSNPYGEPHTLVVYNALGQQVQKIEGITGNAATIERNNLPLGCYYYQLRNASGLAANGKFQIR